MLTSANPPSGTLPPKTTSAPSTPLTVLPRQETAASSPPDTAGGKLSGNTPHYTEKRNPESLENHEGRL